MNVADAYHASLLYQAVLIQQLRRAEALSPGQLRTLQAKRLARTLQFAVRSVPFYREFYASHGLSLDRPDQIRLEDLPVIDKRIMMDSLDRFFTDPALDRAGLERFIRDPATGGRKYLNRYVVVHTSGSSGRPGIFVYGPQAWATLQSISFTRISNARLHWPEKLRVAFVGLTDGHYAGITLARSGPEAFVKFQAIDVNQPTVDNVTLLNRFQPHVVSGYASGIYRLALEQIRGSLAIRPEKILCSADPLTGRMATVIQQAFGIQPFNAYAATESIAMAAECDRHDGLHLFSDWHVFEVLRPDGRPAEPGESGSLVITPLYSDTQPLIRYRLDDCVTLMTGTCACGLPFARVRAIEGRVEEFLTFMLPDGSSRDVHPFNFIEFFVAGLEKLQVIQLDTSRIRLLVIMRGDRSRADILADIGRRMDEILGWHGLAGAVAYEVVPVAEIPNDPKTGKYRMVVKQAR